MKIHKTKKILIYLLTAIGLSPGGSTHLHILIYIQHNAKLHSLFCLETALHVSGGTTTHHQERKQLYLQHLLFVRPLLLPAVIAAGKSNGVTNTRCCRYSCLGSWWWVVVPSEYHLKHVEQFPDKINCVTLHLVGYILGYSHDARTHER
jgi:hypothetical protein